MKPIIRPWTKKEWKIFALVNLACVIVLVLTCWTLSFRIDGLRAHIKGQRNQIDKLGIQLYETNLSTITNQTPMVK